ncbi:MAG TPA: hotdog domain-containing protein [Rhodocyclaceae bacterium]|nr:hotdog domain-containing protein [Rhodocyclaceae bacterium]
MSLQPGTIGTAELAVTGIDLATILNQRPDDDFPPVFATTRMIGLMELAASRALHPLLKEGEVSVGVGVDIMHAAATPIGARVTAEARFTGMEGKLYVFEVSVRDPGGEVGRGIHKRAIVSAERLLAGATRRCSGAA